MKKLFVLFAAAALIFAGSCNDEYDDTALSGRVDNLENRVAKLEELCRQMNTNISSLQTIVTALQANDYITSCTPLMENGTQVGYTLTFTKSGSIVIYHGQNGKDGHTPVIGAKTDADGVICWTLDGEWLLDENGHKIPVQGADGANGSDGKDAIAPQLKIEEGCWHISYDGGTTWTNLGKATGENGADGESFFQDVYQDADYVYLILSKDGEKIAVPKHRPLSITFDKTDEICVLANQTYSIGYTLTGADEQTVVKALAQDGFRAVVKKTDNASGTIEITTPATILSSEVLVFVSDGKERTIMRSINFVEGVILITTKSYTVGNEGGTVKVDLSTNLDYTVKIPEADQEWISVAKIESRADMRDESITLNVAANPALTARYSEIRLVDAVGGTGETILITQEAKPDYTNIYFPDANFKAYMVANFDINKDGEISKYEASLITGIDCTKQNIQSLEGIEYCTALTVLECDENQLTALDISNNTELIHLSCYDNQLTALDVSKNTALTHINCRGNQLTVLDVSKNTALKGLYCFSNQLTALDVSGCSALEHLLCHSNQLTALDVSGYSALTHLDCYKNQLTALDISGCSALKYLYCYSNQLTALDVSGCSALTTLDCDSNQLTALDVSNHTALTRLECDSNQLTTLNVSGCSALTILYCYNNQLTALDVSGCSALTELLCFSNQLTALDVSNHTALTRLECDSNQLTALDVSGCSVLKELYCYNNQLTALDISGCSALEHLLCYNNQLTALNVSGYSALTTLYCYSNQLTALDISGCSALTRLDCYSNQLTALNVSGYSALTILYCFSNQLTALDVSGCSALKILSCYTNQLTALDVSECSALTELLCFSNQLTALDVSNNTRLVMLSCPFNQLTALDVSNNTKLEWLHCSDNQLTTLDVSKTNLGNSTNETPLSCSGNPLQTLYLKTGWKINRINVDRSAGYIPAQTEILYKD